MTKVVENVLFFHKEDFLNLVEESDYKTLKDFKYDVAPKLASLFKIPQSHIQIDYPLGLIFSDKCKKADVAVMNKSDVNDSVLVLSLKLESKMGKKRSLDQDLKDCKSKLFKILQFGRVAQGVLLTERRCIFVSCEFDSKFRIYNPSVHDKLSKVSIKV